MLSFQLPLFCRSLVSFVTMALGPSRPTLSKTKSIADVEGVKVDEQIVATDNRKIEEHDVPLCIR